jgi:hypothetical protein
VDGSGWLDEENPRTARRRRFALKGSLASPPTFSLPRILSAHESCSALDEDSPRPSTAVDKLLAYLGELRPTTWNQGSCAVSGHRQQLGGADTAIGGLGAELLAGLRHGRRTDGGGVVQRGGDVQTPWHRSVRLPAGCLAGVVRVGGKATSRAIAGLAAGPVAVATGARRAGPGRERQVSDHGMTRKLNMPSDRPQCTRSRGRLAGS